MILKVTKSYLLSSLNRKSSRNKCYIGGVMPPFFYYICYKLYTMSNKNNTIRFKTASFKVSELGGLTETQFLKRFEHIEDMFNSHGETREKLLKEAYKLVREKYEELNPTKKEAKQEDKK